MSNPDSWEAEVCAVGGVTGELRGSPTVVHFGDPPAEYRALTAASAVADLSARTQIEIVGKDRATFLHNMCTNEIRKLQPGRGCEAFLTDAKGHILAYVFVFCRGESLVLETIPGAAPGIIAHLDRYIIREDVQLHDRGGSWGELLLAGPDAPSLLAGLTGTDPPAVRPCGLEAMIAGQGVHLWRVDLTRPISYFISCPREELPAVWHAIAGAGARPAGALAVETARIEAGSPYFGVDLTDRNLPQEVGRDPQAINFVKGCYLGQETVARIDALGHVNRLLVRVKFAGPQVPAAATSLTSNGQPVGEVTSATSSPWLEAPLALAYVRRGYNAPGSRLESPVGPAEVVQLPVT